MKINASKLLWRLFIIGLIVFFTYILCLWNGLVGDMPSMEELANPSNAVSSEVIADDGKVFGRFFVQDRSTSTYDELGTEVVNALIATEDARFYKHSGVDGEAILRAIFFLGKKGGGSTITQQLAKNLFPRQNPNLFTMPFIKLKEWVLAVKLERNFTKPEIITLYLNTVPFGDNVYGIKNAAQTFYNKKSSELTVDEAAVLIGMLKGNTLYNPRRNPDNALRRRNVVLEQMQKANYLTDAKVAELKVKPIKLNYKKISYHEGLAPYFRKVVERDVKELLKDVTKPDGTKYNIYNDGLKIYTTLNIKMQQYAEASVKEHLSEIQKQFFAQSGYKDLSVWKDKTALINRYIKESERYVVHQDAGLSEEEIKKIFNTPIKCRVFDWNDKGYKDTTLSPVDSIKYTKMFLQTGFLAVDPYTGEVKAWVGGPNHAYFQYDHVNIKTKRQVGSTIKPLLYCLAIDHGITPCSSVSTDGQVFNGKVYNAGGKGGMTSMKSAIAFSINNAALYLIKQVGIDNFADFIKRSGIVSKIERFPSIALGVSDISVYEMVGAYSMFVNSGIQTAPVFITKIEDKHGNLIKSVRPKPNEVISANTAYNMVELMKGVVDMGTGRRIRYRYNFKVEAAGKTGTTNKQTDAWFIGYTPELLAGSWVGCDDQFLRFRSEALGQGAAAALPIWAYFMKKVYADKSLGYKEDAKFEKPEDFVSCGEIYDQTSLDRASGLGTGYQNSEDPLEEVPTVDLDEWED